MRNLEDFASKKKKREGERERASFYFCWMLFPYSTLVIYTTLQSQWKGLNKQNWTIVEGNGNI